MTEFEDNRIFRLKLAWSVLNHFSPAYRAGMLLPAVVRAEAPQGQGVVGGTSCKASGW